MAERRHRYEQRPASRMPEFHTDRHLGTVVQISLIYDKNYTLKKVIVFAIPNMDSYISERLNFGGLKNISFGSLDSAGKIQ